MAAFAWGQDSTLDSLRKIITPVAQPAYPRFARIVDGDELISQSGKTYAEIAEAAFRHANTVSGKFRGGKGEYFVVHDCFTGLNRLTGNAFSRRRYVKNVAPTGGIMDDSALDHCLVFPRLRDLISTKAIRDYRQLGDECGVKTMYIDHMKEGRPVAENIVMAYFKAVSRELGGLNETDEIFR